MGAMIDNESGEPYFSCLHYKVQQDFILIVLSIDLDLSGQIIVFGVNFHCGISISRNETENKTEADITPSSTNTKTYANVHVVKIIRLRAVTSTF